MSSSQEIIITLLGGTFLLLFLVVVVIIAVLRYQNRKRVHLLDIQRLKFEGEQQLLKTRMEVHEKTLTDVSREIHDNIGQILSVVKLNLHSVKPQDEKIKSQVGGAIDLVNRAIGDLRNLSKVLNADFITQQPLSSLLRRETEVINKAETFALSFECHGEEIDLTPDKKLVVFRIAQECLQNSIKHSNATKIILTLSFEGNACTLVVADDGNGFDYESVKAGNGFTNLRARAALIQADFKVQSDQHSGTLISLALSI